MALSDDSSGEPDAFELRVRFGCGFLVGILLGFAAVVSWLGDLSLGTLVPAMLGGGVTAGVLARYYGDRFWSSLRWWI